MAELQRLVSSVEFLNARGPAADDERYRYLRKLAVDSRLGLYFPQFLRNCQTGPEVRELLKRETTVRTRKDFIANAFRPYWLNVPSEDRPSDVFQADEISAFSSSWTGRRSVVEQCQIVLELGPAALQGVANLIEEIESGLGNGPPEPVDCDALEALKAVHAAIGELVRLAEATAPLGTQLQKVYVLANAVFGQAVNVGRLTVGGLVPAAASIIPTLGTVKALEWITGQPIDGTGVAAIAGGMLAFGGAAGRQSKPV